MVMAWLVPVALVLAVGVGWYSWRRWTLSQQAVRVAHTARVREATRFRTRLARYRAAALALTVSLLAVVFSAATIAGRPSDRLDVNDRMATRDIVLCLDVSGSVIDFDSRVLDTFSNLVKGFQGERVALIIFNSSARTVFPLSDDYTMISEQLREASHALEVSGVGANVWPKNVDDFLRLTTGTEVDVQNGSSLVGDGLVSCTRAFDLQDSERSRTLILATDNEVLGNQLFTLPEASEVVGKRGIKLYGLFIDSVLAASPDEGGMRKAVEDIGGTFFHASDANAAKTIVEDVQQQDAKELGATPRLIVFDRPGIWPAIALAGVGGILIIGWRFRL